MRLRLVCWSCGGWSWVDSGLLFFAGIPSGSLRSTPPRREGEVKGSVLTRALSLGGEGGRLTERLVWELGALVCVRTSDTALAWDHGFWEASERDVAEPGGEPGTGD